jgi:very-short-patch-repair endonuclease
MWRLLYDVRKAHNFRRQVPLGPYFADFACHSMRLVIEIDGDTRGAEAAIAYDAARTRFIEGQGYRVIRFTNHDVTDNPEGVLQVLSSYLHVPPSSPPPRPSPRGGGSGTEIVAGRDDRDAGEDCR